MPHVTTGRLLSSPIALLVAFLGAVAPLQAEAYVAGYIGGTRTKTANILVQQPEAGTRLVFDGVPFAGRSFESPVYYGYRAGYYVNRHFGIEAEFIHLKIHADLSLPVNVHGSLRGVEVRQQTPLSRYADQFEVSHGLNMVLLNAVARRALGSADPAKARVILVARAGAGPTIPRPEVIIFGAASGAYEAGPVAVQGAAGAELRLWRGVRLLAEYKYTFTPTSFAIPNGRARIDVHSQHVVTGFAIHF